MRPVLPSEIVGAAPVPVVGSGASDPRPPTSLWVLLAANAVPLLGVLFLGWDLGLVLLLYWAESAVILFFSLLKLTVASGVAAFFLVPFFLVHAGMFMAGHLVFLLFNFVEQPADGWRSLLGDLAWALPIFLASHGYSFWTNFRRKGESYKGHGDVMAGFYRRVFALHLTILFGAFLSLSLGSPVWALVLLVALKTGIDGWAHLWERRRQGKAAEGPAAPAAS